MRFASRRHRRSGELNLFGTTRLVSLVSLFALLTALTSPPSGLPVVVAAPPALITTISICDEAHLLAVLAIGGNITFDCSGTITLTTTPDAGIDIAADTNLDASGQNITVDGGGVKTILSLSTPVTVTLKNLSLHQIYRV